MNQIDSEKLELINKNFNKLKIINYIYTYSLNITSLFQCV